MCEVRVIIESDDGSVVETMDDVATILPGEDTLTLVDLFGGQRSVNADFKEVKLLDHTVVLIANERASAGAESGTASPGGERRV
jgi:predicted RNA-binding protein